MYIIPTMFFIPETKFSITTSSLFNSLLVHIEVNFYPLKGTPYDTNLVHDLCMNLDPNFRQWRCFPNRYFCFLQSWMAPFHESLTFAAVTGSMLFGNCINNYVIRDEKVRTIMPTLFQKKYFKFKIISTQLYFFVNF